MPETLAAVRSARRAAFFDVDETLVATKTMASFLNHYRAGAVSIDTYAGPWDDFVASLPDGLAREEVNRRYYALWRGERAEDVREGARRWWADVAGLPGLLVEDGVAALRAHRRSGDLVVLVSGSFDAVLRPVAELLGADAVLCTVPVEADGVLTGDTVVPLIGANKAAAVREYLAEHDLDGRACWAYGDHESDVPMLETVGHPRVVGHDPRLLEHARLRGWV